MLERELLLERRPVGVPEPIEHLPGIQAQQLQGAYLGLWARVEGFRPELSALITSQGDPQGLMRSTIRWSPRPMPSLRSR